MEALAIIVTLAAAVFGAVLGIKRIGLGAVILVTGLVTLAIIGAVFAAISSAIGNPIALILVIALIILALMFGGFSSGMKVLDKIGFSGKAFEEKFSENTGFVVDKVLGAGFAFILCVIVFAIIAGM